MTGRTDPKPGRALGGSALALAGVLALFGPVGACTSRSEPIATEGADTRTVLIPVEGMSCAACAAQVKKGVLSIAGVFDVEVNLVERRARVRFDPGRVTADRLIVAINGLGYRAGAPAEAK